MNQITGQTLIKEFEKWSPKSLAFDWDNVGLQVGTLHKPINKVMITLDVLENVVEEAIEKNIDLIIAHHPLLFVSLKQINLDTPKGRVIQKLIQHDITVYAAHTNLDIAEGGVNDVLAEALDLHELQPLIPTGEDDLYKLAVFVPEDHAEKVRDAVSEAGAGYIGNYSHCTFQIAGEGSFMPQEGTNPFLGKQGTLEKVKEKRIETIVPKSKLNQVIQAMQTAHPYEEAAYDLYQLENKGEKIGVGRIGVLERPMTLERLAEKVKEKYQIPALRVTGNLNKNAKKVAILGGSGEKYIHQAGQMGADVYITGDMTFHMAQDAQEMGLSVIDPGHHVEKLVCAKIKEYLENQCGFEKEVTFYLSEANTEPFTFL
ncbi:Nif3-like dinuclear metal center hexameric protein [Halobacillus salinarum]|uniref:GTP cyclohydrolase 1 type 2 homolog n=1 Tax=Halobacillus salinarum TaxID=2932257 RepID=A0ABY4EEG2_9BACI|nr:Nif3-like dinuclear metal center hexameric protein [Halobacillus salinarum]UOQ42499.1 Nif3-like dinuclear metal center hexameric protein [Halobacillus salinarum]